MNLPSSRISLIISWAALALMLSTGCVPSFHKFKDVPINDDGFIQHRVNANGNATLSGDSAVLAVQLYERKLNGGISAQVVGNSQFIVVGTDNKRLYFLNPQTGKEITAMQVESAVSSAPALADQLLYFAEESAGDLLTCFNLVNGKVVWTFKLHDPLGAPIVSGEEVFIASRDAKVYCLNRWTGEVRWQHDSRRQIYATVAADSSQVVFGNDLGDVICLNRATGEQLWATRTGGSIAAQALLADRVYCGSVDNTMYALNRSNGETVWTFECAGAIQSTPVKVGSRLVFGADDMSVYCLNSDDGGILWSRRTSGIVQSSPIAVGVDFIVANSAGEIIQLTQDGEVKASFVVKGSIKASPAFIDNRLFVGTSQRRLFVFGASESTAISAD